MVRGGIYVYRFSYILYFTQYYTLTMSTFGECNQDRKEEKKNKRKVKLNKKEGLKMCIRIYVSRLVLYTVDGSYMEKDSHRFILTIAT